jgi:hypothetical protein
MTDKGMKEKTKKFEKESTCEMMYTKKVDVYLSAEVVDWFSFWIQFFSFPLISQYFYANQFEIIQINLNCIFIT